MGTRLRAQAARRYRRLLHHQVDQGRERDGLRRRGAADHAEPAPPGHDAQQVPAACAVRQAERAY
eukprot:2176238-Pyramimonas_sp.AAC.1